MAPATCHSTFATSQTTEGVLPYRVNPGVKMTRRRLVSALGVLLMPLLTGCSARPERPDDGEMTGVVVSTDDACCWPSSGVVDSPNFSVVALIPPDDFVRMWNAGHPDDREGPITPDDWRAQTRPFKAPLSAFTDGDHPGSKPSYDSIVEGRWRVPYGGDPVMVCVGSKAHDDEATHGNDYLLLRCGLVDEPSPVGVTVSVQFGGIGVKVG